MAGRDLRSCPGIWEQGDGKTRYWLIPEDSTYQRPYIIDPEFDEAGRVVPPSVDDSTGILTVYADEWYETIEVDGAHTMRQGKDIGGRNLRGHWVRVEYPGEEHLIWYCFHRERELFNGLEIVEAPGQLNGQVNGNTNGHASDS